MHVHASIPSVYTQASLDTLRQGIDLVELLSHHLELKRAGGTYKACCPFHEEKTPSFFVKRGDSCYHCFGCGAHGDAIAFLMGHVKMGFVEAVEYLGERFGIPLEKTDKTLSIGPTKGQLKDALEFASRLYHFLLLHSEEGHKALEYLYQRGLNLPFLRDFQIGYAPSSRDALLRVARREKWGESVLEQAGLIRVADSGRRGDFFTSRILFPIRDAVGAVIGFSARKFQEQIAGGKYINTPDTPLFRKSKVLFGLSYCRKRIAKERRAVIVEGQIDTLRLIHEGLNITVAGQGTAFGEGHVRELLHLGVKRVILALDPDLAGRAASYKIGHLFQQKGVDVQVALLPVGMDPDGYVLERGIVEFTALLEHAQDYLTFAYAHLAQEIGTLDPASKAEIVETLTTRIRAWEHPVMIHESLRKLAVLAGLPYDLIEAAPAAAHSIPSRTTVAKTGHVSIDPQKILELDLLRWILRAGLHQSPILALIQHNISASDFSHAPCRRFFEACFPLECPMIDLLAVMNRLGQEDASLMEEVMQKKINLQKAEDGCSKTIEEMLKRKWLAEAERLRQQIHSGKLDDQEALVLAKQFAEIKKNPPQVRRPI